MIKSLEALFKLLRHYQFVFYGKGNIDEQIKDHNDPLKIIHKTIKALEIIEKHFKIEVYHSRHRETSYEMCISNDQYFTYCAITEEEYDLLKEVLL